MKAWALLDLLVTGLLALPWVASAFIGTLYALEARLVEPLPQPAFAPVQLFFVHLAGVLGVLWALARILEPTPFLARCDCIGRCFVALLILYAMSAAGAPAPRILLLFVATEAIGAAHQAYALRRERAS